MKWYYILLIILACILLIFFYLILPGNKKKCNDSSWLYKNYIAHRGLFNNEKGIIENSSTAFLKAIEKNFTIETDLHLTLDNKVLLWDELRLCGAYPKLLLVLILRILVYMN